jgi:peroxiredoxin
MQYRFLMGLLLALGGLSLAATEGRSADSTEPLPARVGRTIENFTLGDVRGKQHSLADFKDHKILVVAFIGVECPLAKQYAGRLVEIAAKYKDQGVGLIAIDSNQQDSLAKLTHFERTYKIEFPLLKDPGNSVADQFLAERTPEVFVLDADRKVRYYGRIDDQFTYGRQKNAAERHYLLEALDALLADKPIATPETESIGCHIGRVLEAKGDSKVTYSKHISHILNKRCVECHRPGEIGPFSLRNYDEVVGWAEMINEVVQEQRMPPWHADPKHGKFSNDTRLSDEDKQLIRDWVAAGAPEGDPADMPPAPEFVEGWRIGEPDMVVYMSDKSFNVPARGEVRYQHFLVDPGFKEDKWIQAAECRPGNREVVHHIIVAVKAPGKRLRDSGGELDSDWLTATAPGARPLVLKEGMAKLIPAGSQLVFQLHYTPNGTAQEDRSCVGFKFADPKTVQREVATHKAANQRFVIPPGDASHRVEADYRFEKDSLLLALFPHMHLRGKSFKYEAFYPDGKQEVLLDVPQYDFNWQNGYSLAEPKRMPAGTRIHCTAHFDNSEDNLANPDPTARVRWGDQTWEEMMIGYFDMALADQDLTKEPPSTSRAEQFLTAYANGQTEVDARLLKLAAGATESNVKFIALGTALRSQFPQLDRMCLTALDGETLEVKRVVQEPRLRLSLGAAGIKVAAKESEVATIAAGAKSVMHADLDKATAPDLKLMSRGVASSLHVPVKLEGAAATINFWSTDKDAFPPEAVKLLEELAQAMAK